MTAEWITKPGPVEIKTPQRHFTYVNDPHSGFMFDVDEMTGNVVFNTDAARDNYARALTEVAAGTMVDHGVEDFTSDHWHLGTIRCSCGTALDLSGGDTTTCQCGNEYNSCAQLLRPNWREFCRETGELDD
ncbi:hypothetical protein [Deinococcus aquaedulcis]|uniref:hypothetical protein n=1 Tax=Deinococcus aquaedulcis TaxID=2840455 RepID=UPI001C840A24|nr:hypothetical protein [Deinococcus aquaedulcis]